MLNRSRNFTDTDLGLLRHFDPNNTRYLIADKLKEGAAEAKQLAVLSTRQGTLEDIGSDPRAEVMTMELEERVRKYKNHWRHPAELDQGNTPKCTGYSGAKVFLAGPSTHRPELTALFTRLGIAPENWNGLADLLYATAEQIDITEHGYNFGGGATMLALAKAGQRLGLWKRYWWGYSLADYMNAIRLYPVLFGIWWREGMDNPDRKYGIIRYTGGYRGGHSIASDACHFEDGFARFDQTWGRREFGVEGYIRMPLEDVEVMIAEDGELLIVEE